MPPTDDTAREARALWNQLLVRALRRGVPYADAQDLAGQAVLKALEAFTPERGSFEALCGTIHANLVKNWWRDRKPTEPWDDGRHDRPGAADPGADAEQKEWREMCQRVADLILADLDPQEAALFLALGEQCREAERATVAAAARRVGIETLEAWNVFRRIQRKARQHLQRFLGPETALSVKGMPGPATEIAKLNESKVMLDRDMACEDALRYSDAVIDPGRQLWSTAVLAQISAGCDAGFGAFSAQLTAEQRRRLSANLV